MENCFYGPQSKSKLVAISACQNPMYLGLGSLLQGGLFRSILFLHLNQTGKDQLANKEKNSAIVTFLLQNKEVMTFQKTLKLDTVPEKK